MTRTTIARMLPTNTPNQGRWVHYRTQFWPSGDGTVLTFNPWDHLAQRMAYGRLERGHSHVNYLKRDIKRRLGIKALPA